MNNEIQTYLADNLEIFMPKEGNEYLLDTYYMPGFVPSSFEKLYFSSIRYVSLLKKYWKTMSKKKVPLDHNPQFQFLPACPKRSWLFVLVYKCTLPLHISIHMWTNIEYHFMWLYVYL